MPLQSVVTASHKRLGESERERALGKRERRRGGKDTEKERDVVPVTLIDRFILAFFSFVFFAAY